MTLLPFSPIYYDHSISGFFAVFFSSFTWLINDRIPHSSILKHSFHCLLNVCVWFFYFICSPNPFSILPFVLGIWASQTASPGFPCPLTSSRGWPMECITRILKGGRRANTFISSIFSWLWHSASGWVTFNYSSCEVPFSVTASQLASELDIISFL